MPSLFLTSAAKGRRIVLWSLVCFALSQLALSLYLDQRRPEIRDPVYGFRLRSLQARLAESPKAPLLLLLGSSRVKYSICPGAMDICTRTGERPVIYNFGIDAMGPIRSLMYLRRLLAEGIHPDWLLMEVWPLLFTEANIFQEARQVPIEDDVHWRDVPLVCRYFRNDLAVMHQVLRSNLLPISAFRSPLIDATVRFLLPQQQADEMSRRLHDWLPDDDGGWFPMPEVWKLNTPQRQRGIERTAADMKALMDPLVMDPRGNAALSELLEDCRRHGIQVALILLPEHSLTRGWYGPQARAVVGDYLGRLQQKYRVPIVDTRTWVPDDDFADDYVHLQCKGVPRLSVRLGREVVQPLVQGRALDRRILFVEDAAAR